MGELYVATTGDSPGLRKLCVVKTALHPWVEPDVAQALHEEAQFALSFDHPNLVFSFDAGDVEGVPYLAMEFVQGKDLHALIRRCKQMGLRIPAGAALHLIAEACRGLARIHGDVHDGLIHRDIAPSNLLLGYRGEVKLADFGLAGRRTGDSPAKRGRVMGHLGYLSPEQARGDDATIQSDIYSLGVILWEILTGRALLPRGGGTDTTAFSALRNPRIVRPSTVVNELPREIDDLVLGALEVVPQDRYPDARAFRRAILEIAGRVDLSSDDEELASFVKAVFRSEFACEAHEFPRYVGAAPPVRDGRNRRVIATRAPKTRDIQKAAQARLGLVLSGRYRLDSVLAIGGMGTVYRGIHLGLDKPIAIKVLHAVYRERPTLVRRFAREARTGTRVPHPSFVEVFDVGQTPQGDPYFVMELLEGPSLDAVLTAEGQLPLEDVVSIGRRIAEALEAAHRSGIVHRDLKPGNIVVVGRGSERQIKVVDFGICKHETADSCPTTPGLIVGSPDYMAPEQASGVDTGPSVDIYALGCILFEMCAGRPPFRGRTALEVLMRKGAGRAPDLREIRRDLPEALAELVDSCLDRRAGRRPASMEDIAGRLATLEAALAREGSLLFLATDNGGGVGVPQIVVDDETTPFLAEGERQAMASGDTRG